MDVDENLGVVIFANETVNTIFVFDFEENICYEINYLGTVVYTLTKIAISTFQHLNI